MRPNITEIPIPERMARRPQYKGIVVPALTLVEDGVPNFKMVDGKMIWKLKQEQKCGLCGEPLDYWIAFMVNPNEAETRLVYESPNHEECLRYAFQVCPWLYYSKAKYSDIVAEQEKAKEQGIILYNAHPDRLVTNDRPQKLGIYICNSYKNVIHKGFRVCKVSKEKRIEWIEGK